MPCALPVPAVQSNLTRRVSLAAASVEGFAREYGDGFADELLSRSSLLFLPCGSCVGCQLSRAREWAVRCSLELSSHPVASFVTLTYSERYVPPTLSKRHLSLFFKRLRKRLGGGIRFFGCGEYGEKFGRPHYHALVFGTRDEEVIRASWTMGFATVAEVNPARISYVAGYCAKKLGFFGVAEERVDFATGEIYRYQPPFLQMSRRPGIGGAARRFVQSWRTSAVWQGREVPVPRYLHASWLESSSESDRADLAREKLERRMVLTVRELRASEAIARSRVDLKSSGRKL